MSLLSNAFTSLSDLKLWLKNKSGDDLTLADIPGIIPLRYEYFKERWEFIKEDLVPQIETNEDPDSFNNAIANMSALIEVQRSSTNQTVNPFVRPTILTDFYPVFEAIPLTELPISKEEQTIIDRETNKVNGFIKRDFQDIKRKLQEARDEIGDVTGNTDSNYNLIFNRSAISKLRDISIKDINDTKRLQDGIKAVDFIIANSASMITNASIDPFALARENADNPALSIESGKSGRLVRMFYGDSLESLALRFLGSADRWIEIAIANGLKPPYVDEVGEAIPLLSSGSNNQLSLSKFDSNSVANIGKLYVGQSVFLSSDDLRLPEQRNIISIKEVPVSGEIILELNGEGDLAKYRKIDNAVMRIYKPNTVNSNFFVLIPTPIPLDTSLQNLPYFLADKSDDEKQAGIDLAFNDDGDLVFNPTSDFQLSFGIMNAVQAIQIKMTTEQGQMFRHPEFGLASILGTKLDDPDAARDIVVQSINEMIEEDPRFDRVKKLTVRLDGTAFLVGLEVQMAGSNTTVPISFTVNTN